MSREMMAFHIILGIGICLFGLFIAIVGHIFIFSGILIGCGVGWIAGAFRERDEAKKRKIKRDMELKRMKEEADAFYGKRD